MKVHRRGAGALVCLTTSGLLLLGSAGVASASAVGTTHESEINHQATEVFFDVVPCHPELGGYQITAVTNSQFHDTENANGDWVTGTDTGAFAAVPIEFTIGEDPDGNPIVEPVLDADGNTIPREGENFTGHFTNWFGGSINLRDSVFTSTFNVSGVGSGGTTFRAHTQDHIVFGPGEPFNPDTIVKVAFDKTNCA